MTSDYLRDLITSTGRPRHELARLLGYKSKNTLRQAIEGKVTLPADKLAWLIAFAQMRERLRTKLAKAEDRWLEKNPPPSKIRRTPDDH